MDLKSQITHKLPLLFFSAVFGGSLSILCLFNLPLFYEQERSGWLTTFLITFILFSLAITLSFKLLLIPLNYFKDKNTVNILFVAFLSFFLANVFYFTSSYYWSTPNFQSVEICYESNDLSRILNLNSISDVGTGRVFPANFFGYENYPISIPTHTCLTGGIRTVQRWQGIIIDLDEKSGDDFIKVKINRQNTIWPLADNDGIAAREVITVPASAYRGSPIYPDMFSGNTVLFIKWVSLILSSVYLAMLIFALSEIIIFPNDQQIISHKTALLVAIVYFVIFGFLMANHGGQPDQTMHVYYSSRYAETWGIPKDDPKSYFYIEGNEYLYYWINGALVKLYRLLVPTTTFPSNRLIWRLTSIFMSAGTLFYIYKLASKLTGNKFGGVLAAFFCANTLMFVFISGGISYDNMMSLTSAAAIYHMVCILKREDYVKNTTWMGIWLSLGSLSKNQVALLAFILFWVWLVYSIYGRKTIKVRFSRANIILTVIFLLASGLFLEFYGGNLIKYHRPIPSCIQIKKDPEVCTAFSYRGDQRQEVNFGQLWINRNSVTGPFEYAMNYWLFDKINGIWGIISNNTYVPKFITSLHGCLIIWAIFCLVRYWRMDDVVSTTLIIVIISYVGYVFLMNYNKELHYGFRHYAVQGRYLFPVFGAFLAVMVNSFLNIRLLLLKRITLSLAITLYFAGGLGTFIFRYSEVFISWRTFF